MRLAFIADIHGNLPALEAVLQDARGHGVNHVICLGDIVGYGPQPVECLHLIRETAAGTVVGNHDAAVCGRMGLECFNEFARATAQRAMMALSEEDKEWLRGLPYTLQGDCFACTHGSFETPERFPYIDDKASAEKALAACPDIPLLVVGHTHIACTFMYSKATASVRKFPPHDFILKPGIRCVLNPGSVGFPRGEVIAATYLLYDDVTRRVIFRTVRYDLARYRLALVQNSYDVRNYWFLNDSPRRTFAATASNAAAPIGDHATFRARRDRNSAVVSSGFIFLVCLLIALILALLYALVRVSSTVEKVEAVEARAMAALAAVVQMEKKEESCSPGAYGRREASYEMRRIDEPETGVSEKRKRTVSRPSVSGRLPALSDWELPKVRGLRLQLEDSGTDLHIGPDPDISGDMPSVSLQSPVCELSGKADSLNVRFAVDAVRSSELNYTCRVQFVRADGSVRNDKEHDYRNPGKRSYTVSVPDGCRAFRLLFRVHPAGSFRLADPQVYPVRENRR